MDDKNSNEMLPIPRELEEKADYIARFSSNSRLESLSSFKRSRLAQTHWHAAQSRSQVSITTSQGQWLMFN